MKKYVVVGGAGYIGANIVDELISSDMGEVHVIDNLANGRKENVNRKATFHKKDMRDLHDIMPIIDGADTVFLLAALPRVQFSIQNPKDTNEVNIGGTLNVYIAAQKGGVRRVVYSSSSSVYGEQPTLPFHEGMDVKPLSPYGLQKHVGEMYGRVYKEVHGLESVALRYFNVYGGNYGQIDNGSYTLVVEQFLEQKKAGKPLTITGDGSQTRDFTHIKDVIRANILASESDKVGSGEALNIGAGRNHSVKDLARMISDNIVHIEARQEPKDTLADSSLARELLGWEPQISLEEGIEMMRKDR